MDTLYDIYLLQSKLYHWLNGDYYQVSNANFLEINNTELEYDETGRLSSVKFKITWGRYYEEEDKKYLNEKYLTIIDIEKQFLNNYDYILGKFTEKIDNDTVNIV